MTQTGSQRFQQEFKQIPLSPPRPSTVYNLVIPNQCGCIVPKHNVIQIKRYVCSPSVQLLPAFLDHPDGRKTQLIQTGLRFGPYCRGPRPWGGGGCTADHLVHTSSSTQLNFISISLNQRYSLKRLNMPYIRHPLTLAPQRAKKTPLISKEEILRRNTEWGIPPLRDDQECIGCHNWHTCIYCIQAKHLKSVIKSLTLKEVRSLEIWTWLKMLSKGHLSPLLQKTTRKPIVIIIPIAAF